MKKYIYMAVAAIAALSSCTPDETGDVNTNGSDEAFIATIETGNTRTTLGTGDNAGKVFWESGDKISINGVTYTGTPDKDNATKATFEKDGDAATGTTFSAYYPASLYDGTNATLPAEQTYEAGKISNLPMYAQSDDHNLVFKNLCGVLAITVNSSDFSEVSSIDVYSDNWMNGEFTVDASDYSMSFSGTIADANKKLTLSMGTTPMSITTSQVFYVAIPAGTHNLIFKVNGTLNSATTSKVMATKAANGITIERNTIYSIAFAENAVQLWAGGPYWATINVGQTLADYSSTHIATTNDHSWTGYKSTYTTENVGGLYYWGGTHFENVRVSYAETSDWAWYSTLDSDHDMATQLWGSNWRLPNRSEFGTTSGLCNTSNVSSASATVNGIWGYKFTGKTSGYTAHSIFLPAGGYFKPSDSKLYNVGTEGDYWSSTGKSSDNTVYQMHFSKSGDSAAPHEYTGTNLFGRSVRAVLNVTGL